MAPDAVHRVAVAPAPILALLRAAVGSPLLGPVPDEDAATMGRPLPSAVVIDAGAWVAWCLAGLHACERLEFADATVGAVELEDDAFVAFQLLQLSIGWRMLGEQERALYWGAAARSLLSAVAGPEHPAWPMVSEHIGRAIHPTDRYDSCEEALRYFDEALIGYLEHGNGEEEALIRLEIAYCLRQLGQLEGALAHARLAVDHWRDHEPRFMTSRQSAHLLTGHLLEALGRDDEAEAEYERVVTLVDLEAVGERERNQAKRALERLRGSRSE